MTDAERAMVHNTVRLVMLDAFLIMPGQCDDGVLKAVFMALDRGLNLAFDGIDPDAAKRAGELAADIAAIERAERRTDARR